MLLTFSTTFLCDRILDGSKKHTIRKDKDNRWKIGTRIHAWYQNPRHLGEKYKNSDPKDLETYFILHGTDFSDIANIPSECKGVQSIEIDLDKQQIMTISIDENFFGTINPQVMANELKQTFKIQDFVRADGFVNSSSFYHWFAPLCKNEPYKAKIIHWTDLKY